MTNAHFLTSARGLGEIGRPEPGVLKHHAELRKRVCAFDRCGVRLIAYNPGTMCGVHEHNENPDTWPKHWEHG